MPLPHFSGLIGRDSAHPVLAILLLWALASAFILVLVLGFLSIVWIGGGLQTDGDNIDWTAIGALAAVGSSVATAAAISALFFAVVQTQSQARDERQRLKPYLRVDVGFKEPNRNGRGFRLPPALRYFTAADFDIPDQVTEFAALRPQAGETAVTLCLWVSNRQDAAIGTAYNVEARVILTWSESTEGAAAESARKALTLNVQFTYVEPGSTTAIELGQVRSSVPFLGVQVEHVAYDDIFGRARLVDRHGALGMVYRGSGEGNVRHERAYSLGR